MKKCKSGYYYCNTDKKCKPIPRGYRVGYGGYLRKEKDDDDSKSKSNGNGNGNGNGSNGNGNGGNGSGGNGGGGNGGGMGEEVTHEAVAAIPAIAGASKVIPAVVAGVGALGTIMQARRGRQEGQPAKRYNRNKPKRKISDMERKLTDRLNRQNVNNQRVGKAFDTKGLDLNKKSNLITPKDGQVMQDSFVPEAKMTEKEKKKKEEIVMSMKKKKKDFEDRYGEDGKSVMYATATKLAMGEALNSKDKPAIKELIAKLKGSAKAHKQQSKDLEVALKTEGSLHKWFKGSKSKDGKGGWVNVVTGGTCASDEPGEGTPKCVSSSKRASMTKAERLSAARRKKKADPGQQSKSGAAKPTYVSTDSPRKKKKMKEEIELTEVKDKKGKGSGSKDACYHKVKSRYSVWPSAYASGALVKCRKVGAANWGNSKKEEFDPSELSFQQFMEKCWKGYEKKGMKTMFGKRYPNCVKKEETVIEHHQKDKNGNTIPHEDTTPSSVEEGAAWTKKSGKNPSGGLNEKGRKSYERENPGSDLKRPSKKVGNKRRASFCARMRGMKKKLTSAKTARDPDSRINKSLRAWNC